MHNAHAAYMVCVLLIIVRVFSIIVSKVMLLIARRAQGCIITRSHARSSQ